MPLILAIEPDRRQASQLRAMVKGRLRADLVLAESAAPALIALGGRVPDLILVPALLSPADEAAIGDHLRVLDAASAHVQTLIIPVLATVRPRSGRRGVLASLKRKRASAPDGCDPKEFAEQCATYLKRAAAERARRAEAEADVAIEPLAEPVVEALVEPVVEPLAEHSVEARVIDLVVEAAAPEEPVVEDVVAAVPEQDFIELDLSALLDELSELEIVAPMKKAAVPPPVSVEWTAVWVPPGRWWPSMEGVAVETESPVIQPATHPATQPAPSRRAAAQPVAPRKPAPKPIQDEWGFFDPARCGFTALLTKLDEITKSDEVPIKQRA